MTNSSSQTQLSEIITPGNNDVMAQFKFYPLSFSWVALHPKPKRVIQFIGGAFFGSFPTLFYRFLLEQIYLDGYTIIALPFRFTFRHWSVAISLLSEQQKLRPLLEELAIKLGYESKIYKEATSYFWVGHSLGCKYIALLEFLAGESEESIESKNFEKRAKSQVQEIKKNLRNLVKNRPASNIRDTKDVIKQPPSIQNQPSLLIAPDIGDTKDAIKLPFIPDILDYFGLGVLPTKKETFAFIRTSSLFNLTAIISFKDDKIAGNEELPLSLENTGGTLLEILREKIKLHKEIAGGHLRPLGIELGGHDIVGPISSPPRELPALVLNFIKQ